MFCSLRNVISMRLLSVVTQATRRSSASMMLNPRNCFQLLRNCANSKSINRFFAVDIHSAGKVMQSITGSLQDQSEALEAAFEEKNDEMIADALSNLQGHFGSESSSSFDVSATRRIITVVDSLLASDTSQKNQLQALGLMGNICYMKERSADERAAVSASITSTKIPRMIVDRFLADSSTAVSRDLTQAMYFTNRVLFLNTEMKRHFQSVGFCKALTKVLNSHLDNLDFVSSCLMAGRSMCFSAPETKAELIASGFHTPILSFLNQYNDLDEKFMEVVLSTQALLCFGCEPAIQEFSSVETLTTLMKILKKYANNEGIAASGLTCLRNLIYSSVSSQEVVMNDDVVEDHLKTILLLHATHPNSLEVTSNFCPVVLCLLGDETYRRHWDRHGIVTIVCSISRNLHNSIQSTPPSKWSSLSLFSLTSSIKCLKQILFNSDTNKTQVHETVKTILPAILSTIKADVIPHTPPSSSYSLLLSASIQLASSIIFNNAELKVAWREIISQDMMTNLLRRMPDCIQLTEAVSGLISSFAFNDPTFASSSSYGPMISALLTSGKLLQANTNTASQVLRCVAVLTYQSPATCELLASSDALCSIIMRSLNSAQGNDKIVKSILTIMKNYQSSENSSLKQAVANQGGRTLVKRAAKSPNHVIASMSQDIADILDGVAKKEFKPTGSGGGAGFTRPSSSGGAGFSQQKRNPK